MRQKIRKISLTGFVAALLALGNAKAQEQSILPVAFCELIESRKFTLSVTFFNYGARLDRDYYAFVHFGPEARPGHLYTFPAPGLRPLGVPTESSKWRPNEVARVAFGAFTIPDSVLGSVAVFVGLYDAKGDGERLSIIGNDDGARRILVGRLIAKEHGFEFKRVPPTPKKLGKVGVRPRAFVHPRPSPPLVEFGEVDWQKWKIESISGGDAAATRSRENLCWGEASAKVVYSGKGETSGFIIRPPKPIPAPPNADVARLWLLGNAYGWNRNRTPEEPLLAIFLEFREVDGKVQRLHFDRRIDHPFWYVARKKLPSDWRRPLEWTGLGFLGCTNHKPRSFYLDALVLTREKLAAQVTTSVTLDDLPFPCRDDGVTPSQLAGPFTNRTVQDGDAFRLEYRGKDGALTYHYRPLTGTLDDIEVQWGDRTFTVTAEGGPTVELRGQEIGSWMSGVERTCLSKTLARDRVIPNWRWEHNGDSVEYSLTLRILQKSLLVEAASEGSKITRLSAGHTEGTANARFVSFPYWTWQTWNEGRDGGVVETDGLFLSGVLDWYYSAGSLVEFAASEVFHRVDVLGSDGVAFAPGVRYLPRSDGQRNPLRERLIFTVSPNVHEVLPNIPNPPSPNRDKLAPLLHYTGGQASRLDEQLAHWKEMRSYGVEKVYIRHFDGMWADAPQGPQEWTLTEHAAPVVGDARVRRYLDALRGMGFFPVLYTNYTDLQPTAAEFDWDLINHLPGGDVSYHCWPGSYPLKPLRAVELEAKYAPRITERFGTKGSFCDVHTAAPPWHKVDYDARLPGAGQFGVTYRCYGKLLLNERRTYGAVYSEGSTHWIYAGLADGSDAQMRGHSPHREPFLVDFDLLKIHPLEMDGGMSWFHRYFWDAEAIAEVGGTESAYDRYIAATIAFGHQGTFTGHWFRDYQADIKTYYMLQQLQTHYAMTPVEEIRYHHEGQLLTTSQAITTGAYRDSQVYVRYENGLEVWVNGSLKKRWEVKVDGRVYALPPSGFVCVRPELMLEYSALFDNARVDYARTAAYRFMDARGARQKLEEFDTDGAVIARKGERGAWIVWPLGNLTVLAINVDALGLPQRIIVARFDWGDKLIAKQTIEARGSYVALPTGGHTFRLVLSAPESER